MALNHYEWEEGTCLFELVKGWNELMKVLHDRVGTKGGNVGMRRAALRSRNRKNDDDDDVARMRDDAVGRK